MKPEMTERFKAATEAFNGMIRKNGWAAHYVPLDEHHINYHTHGVQESYGHQDFQIVLPLGQNMAHILTNAIIERVKAGEVFEEDKPYLGLMKEGYPISFKKFVECGRDVLRILICDKNKLLPGEEGCNPGFVRQLDVLEVPGEYNHERMVDAIVTLTEDQMLHGHSFNGTVSYIRTLHNSDDLERSWPAWDVRFEDGESVDQEKMDELVEQTKQVLVDVPSPQATLLEKRAGLVADLVTELEFCLRSGTSFDDTVAKMRKEFVPEVLAQTWKRK
jgi:hypothetical protein